MKYLKYSILLTTIFSVLSYAQDINDEGEPTTVKSLLELVQEGRTVEQDENSIREAQFLAEKNKQAAILEAEKRELARQERIAEQLEAEYKANEEILKVKEEAYKKELGSLVELFGHLQSTAGEASSLFSESLTAAEYGRERELFLNELSSKMSEATVLPTIIELERLWFELQREMVAGSEVSKFTANVINLDGESISCEVTRVALYNAVCDGKYLEYIPSKFNKYSIILAIKESDKQIGKLLGFAKKNNSDLLIISGMGQKARERGVYLGELQFHDFQKLKKVILFTEKDLAHLQLKIMQY